MGVLESFSLSGKRALVTGAGRGLGASMARALVEAGAAVALVSRTEAQLVSTAGDIGVGAVPLPWDVSETDSIVSLVDAATELLDGPVDIVLHAAGIQHRRPAAEFEHVEWDRIIATNLTAPFFLSQEIGARQLGERRGGSHIFVCSLGSHYGIPNVVAYTASKSGVLAVVRNLAVEWASSGVRVNGLGPGYLRTELTRPLLDDPVGHRRVLSRIPMGRLGEPPELGGAAVFLASEASGYVTGQLVMVDGGWTAA